MRSVARVLTSIALASAAGAQLGTVVGQHKISSTTGGLSGPLRDGDNFGAAVAAVGDVNADGVEDLAVGAPYDDDGGPLRGAVWLLFLDPSGGLRGSRKISSAGGFPGVLADYGSFGSSLAPLGDIDGDGIPDLAIGAPDAQLLWVCMLRLDGSVRFARSFSITDPLVSPPLLGFERFAQSLASVGDIDGNGVTDLAMGCPRGGSMPGVAAYDSIWLVRLTRFAAVAGAQLVGSGASGILAGMGFGWNLAAGDVDGDLGFDLVTAGALPRVGHPSLFKLILDTQLNLANLDEVHPSNLELYYGLSMDAGGMAGLAFTGDLDGDGGLELLIGAPHWRPGLDVPRRRGAVLTAFTRLGAQPRRRTVVSANFGGFTGPLTDLCAFGHSLAPLGDLDGDGVPDLAVGSPGDKDGGPQRGAVWILNRDGSPLRNGSGVNPQTLSEVAPPVMARPWLVDLDCSGHASGFSLLAGYAAGQPGLPSLAGEVLVDPTSMQLFRVIQGHTGGLSRFSLLIPADVALISLEMHLQGLCAGAPGPQLGNALDEILSVP